MDLYKKENTDSGIPESKNAPIRMVELFSGVGAQRAAMRRLGIPFESVAMCEIDPYAEESYRALHGDTPNLGDITKVEHLPECDLLTWSYPCTSVSLAGRMEGMEEGSGTASSLGWEVIRLLKDARERGALPRILVMENVTQVHSKRNLPVWERMLSELEGLGYTNTWWDLNATEFDIPQNRARCFMVSMLDGSVPERPEPRERTRRLRDMLEEDVDERYFLTEDRVARLVAHRERNEAKGNGFGFTIADPDGTARCVTTKVRDENDTLIQVGTLDGKGHECIRRVYDPEGASPTVTTPSGGGHMPKIAIRNATKEGYLMAGDGDGVDLETRAGRRGTVQDQRAQTIKTSPTIGVVDGMRIRRLTPREVWRLMDFSDEDFDRAASAKVKGRPMSETQLYRQAGNSICVGVLVEVIGSALRARAPERSQSTLDAWGDDDD